MTPDEAIRWLEARADYYALANNSAMETTKYRREESIYWEIAEVIRDMIPTETDIARALCKHFCEQEGGEFVCDADGSCACCVGQAHTVLALFGHTPRPNPTIA